MLDSGYWLCFEGSRRYWNDLRCFCGRNPAFLHGFGFPTEGCPVDSEHGETCQILGSGEEVEVGPDLRLASDPCPAPPVATPHQVADLAFDLGAVGSVAIKPFRVLLPMAGFGKTSFMRSDSNAATARGLSALGS